MGGVTSKSPLERRNTVARRSQRRTLHSLKPKIDNVYRDIKKFKGTTEDANYEALVNEIDYLKTDLQRRAKDLQPQVRNLYENIYKRISEAENELKEKLVENQEKLKNKEAKQKEKDEKTNSKANGSILSEEQDPDRIEVMSDTSTVYPGSHFEDNEAQTLEHGKENTKTVELKVIKIVPKEDTPKSPKEANFRTPEEKRKSILKTGVAVMPGAILKEMFSSAKRSLRHSESNSSKVQFEDNKTTDVVNDTNSNHSNVFSSKVQYQNNITMHNNNLPRSESDNGKLQHESKKAINITDGINKINIHGGATSPKVQFITQETTPKEVSKRINEIIEVLQETEVQISEFVGRKNGKLYNKINDKLNNLLMELDTIQVLDDDNFDQQQSTINYINSCLNFLNERATDVNQKKESYSVGDDEVFFNNNVPMAKRQASVEDILKLQSLMKNTSV